MADTLEILPRRCTDSPHPDAAHCLAPAYSQLTRENESLAEEVLHCYEQINFLFDVSAQIAGLNDGEELRRLLLVRLRDLFEAEAVYCLSADYSMLKHVNSSGEVCRVWASAPTQGLLQQGGLQSAFHGVSLPAELETAIQRLKEKHRVFAFMDDAGATTGHSSSMWGPLLEDDGSSATIGLIRRCRPFVSADMLLFDSTLTYASHVLDNLRLLDRLKRTSFEAVRALVNAIEQKDTYTAGHSERVGFLARVTGEHIGLSALQVQQLEWAGLLHDIGKIGIPEDVLNKPGRLTAEEYGVIKGHPSRSFEVLRPVAQLGSLLEAVLYHHENPDGTGYPRGLKGEEIPLMARIIHVVDVFDALTSTRSYRQAYDASKAVEILKADAGTKLDAKIVEDFLETWALLPQTCPEEYERWFGNIKHN